MFNNNEQFVLVSIFPFVLSQNILPNKNKNQIITLNKINNFGSYLAGLIEGDGSFYVPDNVRNYKGKLNQASIEIVFTKYDLSLANAIIKQIGGGYLIKNENYLRIFFKDKFSILRIVNLINGEMRTPKIEALHRLINWSNQKWSLNIPLLGINITPLQTNAWLSGLIDADGSFYLNWLYDKSKLPTSLQYYLRISQRKIYATHSNNLNNIIFMNNIANLVNINLRPYERKRLNSVIEQGYLVRTAKILSNYIIISYLINFPLFSHKHVCVSVFIELYKLQVSKRYKNSGAIKKLEQLKLKMKSHSVLDHNKYLKSYFYKN